MTHPTDAAIAQANELMACPFCGGADIRQGEDDFGWYQVYCADCGSCMEDSLPHKAIAAWNRRTPARELDAEKGGEDEFVALCHDGQPCKKLYGPTEYPAPKAATPPPNWCRTCGKHWSDPMAVFCSDGIHNPNKPATPPAQAAEAVERVVRALFGLAQNPATWGWWHDSVRDQYREQARAAVAAMQEVDRG